MRIRGGFFRAYVPLIAIVLLVSACADPLGPAYARVDDLEAKAALSPTRIAPGDSAQLRVTLVNHAERDTIVSFAMGCPFYLEAEKSSGFGSPRVELAGTTYGCTAAGSAAPIAAGDSVVYDRYLHGRIGQRAAPSGTYNLRVEFTTALPPLEVSFKIE